MTDFLATADRKGLYQLGGGDSGTYLYYVELDPPRGRGPASLRIAETWAGPATLNDRDRPGWFVFADEEPDDPVGFAEGIREAGAKGRLPQVGPLANGFSRRCVAWIPGPKSWLQSATAPDPCSLQLVQYSFHVPWSRSVAGSGAELVWPDGLRLKIAAGSRVDCSIEGRPRFEVIPTRLDLRSSRGALTGVYPPVGGAKLEVPLTTDQAGTFVFRFRSYPAMAEETKQINPLRPGSGAGLEKG